MTQSEAPIMTLSTRVSTRLCPFGVSHCKLAAALEKAAGAGFREPSHPACQHSQTFWLARSDSGLTDARAPHAAPLCRGFAVESGEFNSLCCISDGKEGYGR